MKRAMAVSVVIVSLVAGCGGGDEARTYYDSLDLGTPVAAVEILTDSFARDDFMTVWLVLDPLAQTLLRQALDLLQYDTVLAPAGVDALTDWIREESFYESLEQTSQWYFFDQAMLRADEVDGFLIDLSGDVDIEEEVTSGDVATVTARVEGIEEVARFRLTRTPTGRWRVHQVTIGEGDPDLIPWSVP